MDSQESDVAARAMKRERAAISLRPKSLKASQSTEEKAMTWNEAAESKSIVEMKSKAHLA